MENEQKIYEIGYLITPLLPDEKLDEEVAVLRKTIEGKKGLIMNEGRPKSKKLSYSIRTKNSPSTGFETAYFGWIKFTASSSVISEIKLDLDKNINLVRFLIINTIEHVGAQKKIKTIGIQKRNSVASSSDSEKEKEKEPIKPEEIDKKLDELIGKDDIVAGGETEDDKLEEEIKK